MNRMLARALPAKPVLLMLTDDIISGGTGVSARRLALGLMNAFSVHFACVDDERTVDYLEPLKTAGIQVHHYNALINEPTRSILDFKKAARLLNLVRPDIVLCCDSGVIISHLQLKKVCAKYNIPYVTIINGYIKDIKNVFSYYLDDAVESLHKASALIFVAGHNEKSFLNDFPDVKRPMHVIPTCCDDRFFSRSDASRTATRRGWDIDEDTVVFYTPARIQPAKGQILSIRALGMLRQSGNLPNVRLVMTGRPIDNEDARIKKEAEELGIAECVAILGELSDIEGVFDASDCFLLASYSEGTPIALCEAMAKGLPIIATSVGDIPAYVNDDCGVLIPAPADAETECIEALAHAIGRYANRTINHGKQGTRARMIAEQWFRSDANFARYQSVLFDVLDTPRILPDYSLLSMDLGYVGMEDMIDFNDMRILSYLESGWSIQEPNGIWCCAEKSTMQFEFAPHLRNVTLEFLVAPLIWPGCPEQRTDVIANGVPVATWTRTSPKARWLSVEIDLDKLGSKVDLDFIHQKAATPKSLDMNPDPRLLSYFFMKMRVRRSGLGRLASSFKTMRSLFRM